MAVEDEQNKQNEEKGFAGLSAMVSDVDDTVASALQQAQRVPPNSSSQQSEKINHPVQPPTQPSGRASTGKWMFGVVMVIGVIWLASQLDNKRPSVPAYSPGPSSASIAPAPTLAVAPPKVTTRPTEEKPSVGRNSVLTDAQIRYCLAEKIRLDAAEIVINKYIDTDVDRFNGYATDYNSRCGEFRYRQGALESAQRDVEPYRTALQSEGRNRLVRSPAAGTKAPSQAASRAVPDPVVQAVQLRLNELGYEVGIADGIIGAETRTAIKTFQRSKGLVADGVANTALLRQLEIALPQIRRQNSNPILSPSSFKSQSQAPANSWVSGSTWYCNDGYRKIGDKCEAFKVPANSWVSGSTWYCNDGYRKIGDKCEAFKVPANSWVSGSTWYCNDGYRKVGDSCEAFKAPANSWVSGSTWYCNDGYRKVGEACVSIFKQ